MQTCQCLFPCLGYALVIKFTAEAFGGNVVQSGFPIHGKVSKIYHSNSSLFKDIESPFNATRYHSLIVKDKFTKTLKITAYIDDGTIMAIEHLKLPIFGVQFHPESIATESGHQLLLNFINLKKNYEL